jgi:tRNA uridine 5-carbamoylmethylation protein Kti12
MKKHPIYIVVGKPGSGRSSLAAHISKFFDLQLISPTSVSKESILKGQPASTTENTVRTEESQHQEKPAAGTTNMEHSFVTLQDSVKYLTENTVLKFKGILFHHYIPAIIVHRLRL